MIGLFLSEIPSLIKLDTQLRRQTGTLLRDTIWRIDVDDRYNDLNAKRYIAQMFFPVMTILVDNPHLLDKGVVSLGEARACIDNGIYL